MDEDCGGITLTLEDFRGMLDIGLKRIKLIEMKRGYGSGEMYCKQHQFERNVRKGECGWKKCRQYWPCNHIKGRCRFLDNCFVETGRKFILTKEGLKEIK